MNAIQIQKQLVSAVLCGFLSFSFVTLTRAGDKSKMPTSNDLARVFVSSVQVDRFINKGITPSQLSLNDCPAAGYLNRSLDSSLSVDERVKALAVGSILLQALLLKEVAVDSGGTGLEYVRNYLLRRGTVGLPSRVERVKSEEIDAAPFGAIVVLSGIEKQFFASVSLTEFVTALGAQNIYEIDAFITPPAPLTEMQLNVFNLQKNYLLGRLQEYKDLIASPEGILNISSDNAMCVSMKHVDNGVFNQGPTD